MDRRLFLKGVAGTGALMAVSQLPLAAEDRPVLAGQGTAAKR